MPESTAAAAQPFEPRRIPMIEMSTNNLTDNTVNNWAPFDTPSPVIANYEYGLFVYVPDDMKTFLEERSKGEVPEDLVIVLQYAKDRNIEIIRFDRDADLIEDLPCYDW